MRKMTLTDYQMCIAVEATELLHSNKIAMLCMEMRVGKTLTALKAADLYGAEHVLFVTKKKAISSIENDYNMLNPEYSLHVINYGKLHKVGGGYDFIVIDESHSLGQYPTPSERTKRLKEICKFKPIIYLTGTPNPETYSQLYHQLFVSSFSPWHKYRNFYEWFRVYGIPGKKYFYNREVADYKNTKTELVINDIKHLIISLSQKEAGFKVEAEDVVVMLPMPVVIKDAISKIRRNKLIRTKDGHIITADSAAKEMSKVHQLCGGTIKTENGVGICADDSKAKYINNHFNGMKIAIFYKYIAEGTQLIKTFGERVTIDSEEFNNSNDKIYIAQYQSGREGVNLATADCLIMYNIDFAAVSYFQARARLINKDRTKPAKVYWLFFEGGIEEKIFELVKSKKNYTLYYYKKNNDGLLCEA